MAKIDKSFTSITEGIASTLSRGGSKNPTVHVLWPRVAVLTNGTILEPVVSILTAWIGRVLSACSAKVPTAMVTALSATGQTCNASVYLSAGPQHVMSHMNSQHPDRECTLMCGKCDVLITSYDAAAHHLGHIEPLHHWATSPFRPKLARLVIDLESASRVPIALRDVSHFIAFFEIDALQTHIKVYLEQLMILENQYSGNRK